MRRGACALAVIAALLGPLAPARGDAPPVAVGEVSTSVVRGDVDLNAVLRASVLEELGALDLHAVPTSKRAILSVSLVRMDTLPAADATPVTTCVVSATLRDARRGAVFAIMEGQARAGGEAAARALVHSAVRGAMARIPEALAR